MFASCALCMRAVGRTDPNTRRELRSLCTAASCTLSAPAVVPPHKPFIDHTSPTRPRGPFVSKRPRQSLGRPRGRCASRHGCTPTRFGLASCRRWRAQQSKSFPTSTCTFVRARLRWTDCGVGGAGSGGGGGWRPVRRLSCGPPGRTIGRSRCLLPAGAAQ